MPTDDEVKLAADALQADMAEHQRRFNSGHVTADANQRLVASEFEKLEKDGMFDRADRQESLPEQNGPSMYPQDNERRIVEGHGLIGVKEKDNTRTRPPSQFEFEFMMHAVPRLQLLLTKRESSPLGGPSWAQRVTAVQESRALAASLRMWASDPAIFRKQKTNLGIMNPVDRGHMFRVLGITGPSEFTVEALNTKAGDLEKQYLAELLIILDESSIQFGDWRRSPTPRIQVGGN